MDEQKERFISYLLTTGALAVFDDLKDDRTLKSGRISPWFVNMGDFNDGKSTNVLGNAYATKIIESGLKFDTLYGIPEKGVALAIATSMGLANQGDKSINVPWFFTRKDEKSHGEASKLGPDERIKKLTVGRAPEKGAKILQLDDVMAAGTAKYDARKELESLGDFNYPYLVIALDRQEVGTSASGESAIDQYEKKTGTKVISALSAEDVLDYLNTNFKKNGNIVYASGEEFISEAKLGRSIERISNYLRVYGTESARNFVVDKFGKLEQTIISRDRSVVPACDVSSIEEFEKLVEQTAGVEGIGGYKIGFELGLGYGLPKVAETARKHTDKPLIYDHQKAGTDIPATGRNFARVLKNSGIDTVILFPQAGPETERAWIYHALDAGLKVIVGGRMTHPSYAVSEGGFITDEGALDMYRIAARAGVNNFVVPGNKPDVIKTVREVIEAEGVKKPVFYAPGFIAQGGKISDAAKVAGDYFHGIVGTGIYVAPDMKVAATELTSQL